MEKETPSAIKLSPNSDQDTPPNTKLSNDHLNKFIHMKWLRKPSENESLINKSPKDQPIEKLKIEENSPKEKSPGSPKEKSLENPKEKSFESPKENPFEIDDVSDGPIICSTPEIFTRSDSELNELREPYFKEEPKEEDFLNQDQALIEVQGSNKNNSSIQIQTDQFSIQERFSIQDLPIIEEQTLTKQDPLVKVQTSLIEDKNSLEEFLLIEDQIPTKEDFLIQDKHLIDDKTLTKEDFSVQDPLIVDLTEVHDPPSNDLTEKYSSNEHTSNQNFSIDGLPLEEDHTSDNNFSIEDPALIKIVSAVDFSNQNGSLIEDQNSTNDFPFIEDQISLNDEETLIKKDFSFKEDFSIQAPHLVENQTLNIEFFPIQEPIMAETLKRKDIQKLTIEHSNLSQIEDIDNSVINDIQTNESKMIEGKRDLDQIQSIQLENNAANNSIKNNSSNEIVNKDHLSKRDKKTKPAPVQNITSEISKNDKLKISNKNPMLPPIINTPSNSQAYNRQYDHTNQHPKSFIPNQSLIQNEKTYNLQYLDTESNTKTHLSSVQPNSVKYSSHSNKHPFNHNKSLIQKENSYDKKFNDTESYTKTDISHSPSSQTNYPSAKSSSILSHNAKSFKPTQSTTHKEKASQYTDTESNSKTDSHLSSSQRNYTSTKPSSFTTQHQKSFNPNHSTENETSNNTHHGNTESNTWANSHLPPTQTNYTSTKSSSYTTQHPKYFNPNPSTQNENSYKALTESNKWTNSHLPSSQANYNCTKSSYYMTQQHPKTFKYNQSSIQKEKTYNTKHNDTESNTKTNSCSPSSQVNYHFAKSSTYSSQYTKPIQSSIQKEKTLNPQNIGIETNTKTHSHLASSQANYMSSKSTHYTKSSNSNQQWNSKYSHSHNPHTMNQNQINMSNLISNSNNQEKQSSYSTTIQPNQIQQHQQATSGASHHPKSLFDSNYYRMHHISNNNMTNYDPNSSSHQNHTSQKIIYQNSRSSSTYPNIYSIDNNSFKTTNTEIQNHHSKNLHYHHHCMNVECVKQNQCLGNSKVSIGRGITHKIDEARINYLKSIGDREILNEEENFNSTGNNNSKPKCFEIEVKQSCSPSPSVSPSQFMTTNSKNVIEKESLKIKHLQDQIVVLQMQVSYLLEKVEGLEKKHNVVSSSQCHSHRSYPNNANESSTHCSYSCCETFDVEPLILYRH